MICAHVKAFYKFIIAIVIIAVAVYKNQLFIPLLFPVIKFNNKTFILRQLLLLCSHNYLLVYMGKSFLCDFFVGSSNC